MASRRDERVCEVASLARPGDTTVVRRGSGYLLGDGRVLTACHVVQPDSEVTAWAVKPSTAIDWLPAKVVHGSAVADLAVLRLDEPFEDEPPTGVRWGRITSATPVPAVVIGYPDATSHRLGDAERTIHDAELIRGELRAGPADPRATIPLHLSGSTPIPTDGGGSPWGGLSGAAVLAGSQVLGVVTQDPRAFGGDRLQVTLLNSADDDAALWDALGTDGDLLEDADWPAAFAPMPLRGSWSKGSFTMLRARFGLVPFVGREDQVGEMLAWAQEPAGHGWSIDASTLSITGPGGRGKTRLAARVADLLVDEGWWAGFLADDATREEVEDLVGRPGNKLVVIDYADERRDRAVQLARALSRAQGRTRIVLTARRLGPWLDRLVGEAGDFGPVFEQARQLPLGDAGTSAADRLVSFRAAATAIATELRQPIDVDPPDLSDPTFDDPLFVHLAALTAIDPIGATPNTGTIAERLLNQVLDREDRVVWRPSFAGFGLSPGDQTLRFRAMAVATLTAAINEAQAIAAMRCLQVDTTSAATLARWAHQLAFGDAFLAPLEPDLLAEHLVSRVSEHFDVVGALSATTAERHATQVLTVLNRGAANQKMLAMVLARYLGDHLEGLIDSCLQPSDVQRGDAIAAALERAESSALFQRASTALPQRSHALASVALVTSRESLSAAPDLPSRAAALNNLAIRLSAVGQREAALAAIEEATRIRRDLARVRPAAYNAGLAVALGTLANRLGDLGRLEAALEATEEAAALYRSLARERPDVFRPGLAGTLNNLANRLSVLRRHQRALTTINEAVGLHRALARDRPEAFNPDLAMSLNNLAGHLGSLRMHEQALTAVSEAVALYRELARDRPDAFNPDLATSLNNLATRLSNLDRHEEALHTVQEATTLYRNLARDRPDAFNPDRAKSLNNLATRLSNLDRHEAALTAAEQAIAIRRELARERPETFNADLAGSLNNLGNQLRNLNRHEEALAANEEAVTLYRSLVRDHPGAFKPALATSLNNLAERLGNINRHEEALTAIEEAIAIRRDLDHEHPDTSTPQLATSLDNRADLLRDLGRHQDALAAAVEAAAIRRDLAQHLTDLPAPVDHPPADA